MKFYPNRAQWIVIWVTALLAAKVWLDLGRFPRWETRQRHLVETIICLGLLLAWQVGGIDFAALAKRAKTLLHARTIGVAVAAALVAATAWLTIVITSAKRADTGRAAMSFEEFMKGRKKPPATLPADFFAATPPARP